MEADAPWAASGSGARPAPAPKNIYEALGGDRFFRDLVERFYARIEGDPVLRPLFPPSLEGGKERQFLFLTQFFGGPARYSALHGHPRLRARHLPFPISQAERDRWLGHMLASLEELVPPEPIAPEMRAYFANTSQFLINREGLLRPEFLEPPQKGGGAR